MKFIKEKTEITQDFRQDKFLPVPQDTSNDIYIYTCVYIWFPETATAIGYLYLYLYLSIYKYIHGFVLNIIVPMKNN